MTWKMPVEAVGRARRGMGLIKSFTLDITLNGRDYCPKKGDIDDTGGKVDEQMADGH